MRANALTPAELFVHDPRQLELFPEGELTLKIQPIVEGHGEVKALPVLLRRLMTEAQVWGIDVGRPIRRPAASCYESQSLE